MSVNGVVMKLYHFVALFSVVLSVAGFSYNLWRLELIEKNSTQRTAAFQLFGELAELEQIIYAAHYNQGTVIGSPRKAWVRVGLISSLSTLLSPTVGHESERLHLLWRDSWQDIAQDREPLAVILKRK